MLTLRKLLLLSRPRVIFVLFVSVFSVACSSPKKNSDQVPLTTAESPANPPAPRVVFVDEGSVGRMMAAQLAGRFGLWMKKPDALRYVNLIGQTIVEQAVYQNRNTLSIKRKIV